MLHLGGWLHGLQKPREENSRKRRHIKQFLKNSGKKLDVQVFITNIYKIATK